ncbi:hypothetical protein, partial [Mesorhizobium shonense]|uniref:hypothetical protein n=1 Tax=Mesorhizobium shonense TaxID=1209948 RepID=UPI003393884D
TDRRSVNEKPTEEIGVGWIIAQIALAKGHQSGAPGLDRLNLFVALAASSGSAKRRALPLRYLPRVSRLDQFYASASTKRPYRYAVDARPGMVHVD